MKKYLIVAIIAIIGVIFYNKVYIPKNTYKTITPSIGDLSIEVFGIGELGAKSIYEITAGISSKIITIKSDEGEWVKKGDLLIRLDGVDLPIQVEENKISVKKAMSELVSTQKELISLEAQKKLAQLTYDRYDKLKKQSFASQSEYDIAKADLEVIVAQIESSKAKINSSKIEVERSKKSVKALEEKLSRYEIFAPVDGYIISKDAQEMQTVVLNESILQMVKKEDVWIRAYVDERISTNVKLNDKVKIKLRSQSNKIYNGYVKRIVAKSDSVTQEREVNIAFYNLPIPFYINEQAEVFIQTKQLKNVLLIPSNLIVYKNAKSGVWIKVDNKAHFQELEIIDISESKAAVRILDIDSLILITSKNNKTLSEGKRVF